MNARRARLAAGVFGVWLLGLCGCAVLERSSGDPLPLDDMAALTPGTHYSEVLERSGPPMALSRSGEGMVFRYEHTTLKEHQYGLILPGKLGKWIKAVYASVDARVQTMTYTFGADGRLVDAVPKSWKTDAGDGFSMTLIFSAGSLTDTDLYSDACGRTNNWGQFLLQPVEVVLNSRQNIETGPHGVELNGTSPAVGQHALELRER